MTEPAPARLKPNDLVAGFALLVLCQLGGEAAVSLVRLVVPAFVFPGPVAGIILLLLVLWMRKREPIAATTVANGLLGVLSLLFVPSAVGIMQHGAVIQSWGLPLLLAVVLSTVLTLLVTVGAFILTEIWLSRREA